MSSGRPSGHCSRRLSRIAGHFISLLGKNSLAITRTTSQSFCSNSLTKEQFTEKSQVKSAVHELQTKQDKGLAKPFNYEAVPNDSWTEETLKLHNKLQKLVDESNGLWVKSLPRLYTGQYSSFTSCVDKNGKNLFQYSPFLNKTEQLYKAVCQFGPWTMGPKGYVHGGAISAMLDVVTASLPNKCGYPSVTANLSVDFKLPVPVGCTVLLESNIESIEGRKVYINGEMKSPDGLQVYATAKTLCVTISKL